MFDVEGSDTAGVNTLSEAKDYGVKNTKGRSDWLPDLCMNLCMMLCPRRIWKVPEK